MFDSRWVHSLKDQDPLGTKNHWLLCVSEWSRIKCKIINHIHSREIPGGIKTSANKAFHLEWYVGLKLYANDTRRDILALS